MLMYHMKDMLKLNVLLNSQFILTMLSEEKSQLKEFVSMSLRGKLRTLSRNILKYHMKSKKKSGMTELLRLKISLNNQFIMKELLNVQLSVFVKIILNKELSIQ